MVNKKLSKLICATILCLSLSPFQSHVKAESQTTNLEVEETFTIESRATTKTTTANLNMRTGAGTNYSVILTIPSGKTVSSISSSGSWDKVEYSGKTGYVSNQYLKTSTTSDNAATTKQYEVTATSLNVRSSASTSGSVVGKLSKGTKTDVYSITNGWAKIKYNGSYAYVSAEYLKLVTSSSGGSDSGNNNTTTTTQYEVTATSLNVRSSASTSGSIVGKLSKGTKTDVYSITNGWAKIKYNGSYAYVSAEYLKVVTSSTDNSTSSKSVTAAVYLRKEKNWSSEKLALVSKGEKVDVLSNEGEWSKVKYDNKQGYISSEYIGEITTGGNETSSKSVTAAVYLRKEKNWSSEKLALVSKGEKVDVLSNEGEWSKVKYDNKQGYISSEYIEGNTTGENETTKITKFTTSNLNLRKEASTNSSIITTIPKGSAVQVLETKGSWDKVNYNGNVGYASNQYLSTNSSGVTPMPEYSKITIALDAGHGGTDPGAIGLVKKLKEKDLVLDVTTKVNSKLSALGFKTVMTRGNDTYISLSQRYTIANNKNANLFVSVHFNSASATSAKGIETLYKSNTNLAQNLQNSLISSTGATNRGLKQRNDLAVLNGTKMPAALVELGFLSNAEEEATISNSSYRDKLVDGIVNGIVNYTKQNLI